MGQLEMLIQEYNLWTLAAYLDAFSFKFFLQIGKIENQHYNANSFQALL
jgi:hypothetical protein